MVGFLADGITQVQLEALQRLLHADSVSSLLRRLINEEYLAREADLLIARSYDTHAPPAQPDAKRPAGGHPQ
jgi:hypothetical protein